MYAVRFLFVVAGLNDRRADDGYDDKEMTQICIGRTGVPLGDGRERVRSG